MDIVSALEKRLSQLGPAIDRTVSKIVPDRLENWAGRTARQLEQGGLGNLVGGLVTIPIAAAQTFNQTGGYNTPPLNGIQTGKYGSTDWNPSANPLTKSPTFSSVSGPAAERAYAVEKERARQLTEQDPLFKKYQVAELSKQYNAAKGDEREKIGMQIWAQTNPQLAAKMKPGQTGYSDVATAFQNLSPITGIIGNVPASSFAMPAASAMPGIEMNYGANAPQVAIAGFNPATAASVVAPGAFSEKLPANLTDYLTKPVEANAKFANIDETTRGLLRQAYNQRIK
jgi:hypothetical protein